MTRLLAAALGAALLATQVAQAQETITARAKLNEVIAEAKKWKPDAALVSVGTASAIPDGTSNHWNYQFQSKKTRTGLRIVVLAAGRIIPTDLGEATLLPQIADDFVDSPVVMKSAIAGGFKAPPAGEWIGMGVHPSNDRNLPAPRECWTVYSQDTDFDPSKAVMRSWCVDPKTGKFVTRLAGESGGGKKSGGANKKK